MGTPSPTLARRLLVEAGLTRARAKLSLNLIEGDAADVQHDQKVVEHVSRLRDRPLTVLRDGRDGRLDRLFAELFGALGHAAVNQPPRVGHVRALFCAVLNTLF